MTAEFGPTPIPVRPRKAPWIVAISIVVVLIGVGLLHSPWLSLRTIEVSGAVNADATGHIERLGLGEGAIMVWIDTDEVVQAVDADPWVADVRVQRVFPDRLVVEVLEREPVVWIEGSSEWMLVASDGTVLDRATTPSTEHLRARVAARDVSIGVASDERVWREVVELALVLPPEVQEIADVGFVADELWMTLGEVTVRFGTAAELADKGRVVAGILADGVSAGTVIDVVSSRRPAIIPPPPPLVTDPQPVVQGDTVEP